MNEINESSKPMGGTFRVRLESSLSDRLTIVTEPMPFNASRETIDKAISAAINKTLCTGKLMAGDKLPWYLRMWTRIKWIAKRLRGR